MALLVGSKIYVLKQQFEFFGFRKYIFGLCGIKLSRVLCSNQRHRRDWWGRQRSNRSRAVIPFPRNKDSITVRINDCGITSAAINTDRGMRERPLRGLTRSAIRPVTTN